MSRSVDQQVAFGDELGLRDGEQVIATRCTPSYAVGCTLRPGEYAEVTVAGPEGHRSILVLMRP